MKLLLPIEWGYLNKSVRQSMLPAPLLSHHQSSLMALTSAPVTSASVNEILSQLVGGWEISGGGLASVEFNVNDSLENGSVAPSSGDRAKRHFNLVKSNKSLSLDELKYKGRRLSPRYLLLSSILKIEYVPT